MTDLTLAFLRRRVAHILKPSIPPPACEESTELAEACGRLLEQMEKVGRISHRTRREVDELARLCAGLHTSIERLKCRANAQVRQLTE
jgi:hypothetical protein